MPARRILTNPRPRNARCAGAERSGAQLNRVLKAVEAERGNLSRAVSLLGCLNIAMEYGEMNHKGPYYPDVVELASEMVRKSISALDPINLPAPSRDKVREEFRESPGALAAAAFFGVRLLPRPASSNLSRPFSLRLHRRDYSRAAASNASSADSASANISG
jgi:hypothetical protein